MPPQILGDRAKPLDALDVDGDPRGPPSQHSPLLGLTWKEDLFPGDDRGGGFHFGNQRFETLKSRSL